MNLTDRDNVLGLFVCLFSVIILLLLLKAALWKMACLITV